MKMNGVVNKFESNIWRAKDACDCRNILFKYYSKSTATLDELVDYMRSENFYNKITIFGSNAEERIELFIQQANEMFA